LVAARFALFAPDVWKDLIKDIIEKLDISDEYGNEPLMDMRAQALANIYCVGYEGPFNPQRYQVIPSELALYMTE
jgi:hypothetical protein